jgi:hypothetical protein
MIEKGEYHSENSQYNRNQISYTNTIDQIEILGWFYIYRINFLSDILYDLL